MGEAGVPGDVDAQGKMLVEAKVAAELAAHKGEWTPNRGARRLDLIYRVRRLKLHPIDPRLLAIGL
jgi:hypothetical protein